MSWRERGCWRRELGGAIGFGRRGGGRRGKFGEQDRGQNNLGLPGWVWFGLRDDGGRFRGCHGLAGGRSGMQFRPRGKEGFELASGVRDTEKEGG